MVEAPIPVIRTAPKVPPKSTFARRWQPSLTRSSARPAGAIDDKRGTIEYRTKVAGVLVRRTATIAYERAGERR